MMKLLVNYESNDLFLCRVHCFEQIIIELVPIEVDIKQNQIIDQLWNNDWNSWVDSFFVGFAV
jgi:hypothetical protein